MPELRFFGIRHIEDRALFYNVNTSELMMDVVRSEVRNEAGVLKSRALVFNAGPANGTMRAKPVIGVERKQIRTKSMLKVTIERICDVSLNVPAVFGPPF
jgi:hypothetical protein